MGKGIILGIDFSNDYTQLAYIKDDGNPECIVSGTEDNYQIPTVAGYHEDLKEWYVGEEAVNKSKDEKCHIYKDLLKIFGDENEKQKDKIAVVFLSHMISLAKKQSEERRVKNVLISLEDVTPQVVDVLTKALVMLGFSEDEIKIISHSESFVYYVLNQNRDIWINQVYYLNFTENYFLCRKLKVVKGRGPSVVYVDVDNLSNRLKLRDIRKNMTYADEVLFEYLDEKFKKDVVSGVFLSGEGFYEDGWNKSLKLMCMNRRVFKGNNLIAIGAAYGAKEFFHIPVLENYLIACKGRTGVKVTLAVKHKERDQSVTLSNVGDYWSQAGATVECIMEFPSKILFEITDLLNGTKRPFEIDLTGFPKRPEKTTRIEIDFKYLNEESFEITVRDLGFGEFFKSSGMEVKKTFHL